MTAGRFTRALTQRPSPKPVNQAVQPQPADRVWYRGSNRRDPLSTDTDEELNDHDQLGPGLYLTSKPETAANYGTVKAYRLRTTKGFITKGTPCDPKLLRELIGYADDDDLEIALSNWDEDGLGDAEKSMKALLRSILSYCKDMPEAIQQVALDVYRWKRDSFLLGCRAAGINGIIVNDPTNRGYSSEDWLVLYDPKLAYEVPYEAYVDPDGTDDEGEY